MTKTQKYILPEIPEAGSDWQAGYRQGLMEGMTIPDERWEEYGKIQYNKGFSDGVRSALTKNDEPSDSAPDGYVWRECGHKYSVANCRGCGNFHNGHKPFDEKFKKV